jgi:hypothetical protein
MSLIRLSRLAVLGDCSMLCSVKFEALLNGQTHVEISNLLQQHGRCIHSLEGLIIPASTFEIKNVVDQVEQTGCTGVDDVDMFRLLCIQRAVLSTLQEAVLIPYFRYILASFEGFAVCSCSSALGFKIVTRVILQVAKPQMRYPVYQRHIRLRVSP